MALYSSNVSICALVTGAFPRSCPIQFLLFPWICLYCTSLTWPCRAHRPELCPFFPVIPELLFEHKKERLQTLFRSTPFPFVPHRTFLFWYAGTFVSIITYHNIISVKSSVSNIFSIILPGYISRQFGLTHTPMCPVSYTCDMINDIRYH